MRGVQLLPAVVHAVLGQRRRASRQLVQLCDALPPSHCLAHPGKGRRRAVDESGEGGGASLPQLGGGRADGPGDGYDSDSDNMIVLARHVAALLDCGREMLDPPPVELADASISLDKVVGNPDRRLA